MPVDLLRPPRRWFDDPKLLMPTPLTVTREGRVVGHLATWDTSHTGMPGQNIKPPRSPSGYAYFHTGATDTDTGDMVRVGRITVGTGHAGLGLRGPEATAHYDHTGFAAAVVRAGEDEHGIWLAGAVTPDATPAQVAALRRSPLSGDWRSLASGKLDLIGALAVNVPGFPIPVLATVAASGLTVMLSAGYLRSRVAPPVNATAHILAVITEETRQATVAALSAIDAHTWWPFAGSSQ